MTKITLTLTFLGLLIFSANAQTNVTFYTNYGEFEVETHDSLMPITAGNFISLVNTKYYDGIIFHRIISNFVVQGGDPTGTGTGGPGYTIPDEVDATGTLSNLKQTLSMANSGPNSGGSQFFINLKNNAYLDPDKAPFTSAHPVFGIVKNGWTTVDSIAKAPVDGTNKPINDVVMDSLRITGSYLSTAELNANKTTSKIYPNPATPESILDIYSAHPSTAKVFLYTTNGVLLAETEQQLQAGKTKIPLSALGISEWPNGIYLVNILNGTETQNHRITIVK